MPEMSFDAGKARRRGFWLRQLHQWHWISAALCLVAMLLFAVTGITLNHAGSIEAKARVQSQQVQMPASLLQALARQEADSAPLPGSVAAWLNQTLPVRIGSQLAEWSDDEVYLALPRPGGDGWLSIDRASGVVEAEFTDRGWVAYFNDLHKGRHTGAAWRWFMDVFALACVVFTLSGLWLLQMHARQRRATWPLLLLGLVLPLVIALIFVH